MRSVECEQSLKQRMVLTLALTPAPLPQERENHSPRCGNHKFVVRLSRQATTPTRRLKIAVEFYRADGKLAW